MIVQSCVGNEQQRHEVRLVQDRDACIGHGSAGTVIYSTTLSKVMQLVYTTRLVYKGMFFFSYINKHCQLWNGIHNCQVLQENLSPSQLQKSH